MAELNLYDIPGAVREGYAFGRQVKQANEEEQRRVRLSDLAGQAYAAPADQRGSILQQAVATDPSAGLELEKGLSDSDDRRNQTMVNMARMLTTAPESMRDGLYQRMKPSLQQFGLGNLPAQYDQTVGQAAQSIVQAYQGGGSGVQSTYVDAAGNRVAIMRDGSTQVLGQNDPGMSQQTISIAGPDGRPAQYTFDKRTGNYVPAGASMPGPGVTRFTGPDGMPVAIGDDIPEHVRQQILANPSAFQDAPSGSTAILPDVPVQSFAQSPFVGQSPAEKAASEAAARRGVENSMPSLPSGYRYDASGNMEAIPGGPADPTVMAARPLPPAQRQKLEQNRRKEQQMLNSMDASLDQSINLIDQILERRGQFAGVTGAGALGARIPGTAWADIAAKLDTLKARSAFGSLQEMRANSPTGGALGSVSERELYLLQNAESQLQSTQSPEALEQGLRSYRATLEAAKNRIRSGVDQYYEEEGLGAGSGSQPQTQAQGGDIDSLLDMYR